jgi:hypothetical protein
MGLEEAVVGNHHGGITSGFELDDAEVELHRDMPVARAVRIDRALERRKRDVGLVVGPVGAGGEILRPGANGIIEPRVRHHLVDQSPLDRERAPRTPSSTVQNTSARSRRTLRLSVMRVRPPVPGRTANSGTSGSDTLADPSSVRMM